MMLRLLAGAVVVGTIFVLSPERRQPKTDSTAHPLPSAAGALAAIPGATTARDALAGQVARSLLTDGIERARQALPGAEPKPDPKTARVAPPKP
ncbi:MAG TPA: hypothetical protein VGD16_12010 [Enterovirga sp.]